MSRKIAALTLLGAALLLPQPAGAQSVMCAEPDFAAIEFAGDGSAAPLPLGEGDEDLPWCANAEDPRCAPLDANSTQVALGLRTPPAVGGERPAPPRALGTDHEFAPHAGLRPRAAVSSRLERPPR